ncbi:MAG: hypothetical protein ABSC62_01135 [Terracidiphilus sp.]
MRTLQLPQTESSRHVTLRRRFCLAARRLPRFLALCAALLAAHLLFAGILLVAQTSSASSTATAPAHKPVHSPKESAAHPAAQATPAPTAPIAPNWPANDRPAGASVVWDRHGLLIVASNSSLAQILKEVSTETGVKVEGMDADERVFGTYGPGPARDVLSRLLDGSAYNVLMIGDQGQGAPLRIVLSPSSTVAATAPQAASTPPSPPSGEDTAGDQEPQEQIMQEMQARQLQRQQDETQNGTQNPQN